VAPSQRSVAPSNNVVSLGIESEEVVFVVVATGGSSSGLLQLGPFEGACSRGTVLADEDGECEGESEGDGEGLVPWGESKGAVIQL
jgi:hypothetical protein